MWVDKIPKFQYTIWDKLRNGATVEEIVYNDSICTDIHICIFLGIPLNSFHIFGFPNDTGFRTNVPTLGMRRLMGFHDDVQ